MNALNDINDDEFVPFLHSLGVETYKKSFEWMLNDPDFAGVLRWLYNSLDHNNALTAREEYRYSELQKQGHDLTPGELEASITCIQEQHPGVCIPGDQEAKEDVKLEIKMCKERLGMFVKQEVVTKDLIKQNEVLNEQLTLELTRLNSGHQQSTEDEAASAEECTALAQELETITDAVVDVVADNLEVYGNCRSDKETARRFFAFNPLESYRQSQALFRSHFDLYVSKNLTQRKNDITDEDLRSALIEAKNMEERLSDAAFLYLETSAELSGEQEKLTLVSNYNTVHPSQVMQQLVEARSTLELLEQEELIVDQQMQNAVEELVKSRTNLAVNTAAMAALSVRQQIQTSLTHLVDVWQRAYALDRLLYYSLRQELRTLEEFVQFASQLRQYAIMEANGVATRIESMNAITAEHESCSLALQTGDPLLRTLFTILNAPVSNDASSLVKYHSELMNNLRELRCSVDDGFRRKEDALTEFKNSSKPLREYMWSGSTKQAHCWDKTVASLSHTLRQQMDSVDKRVVEASGMFTTVKNGDKQNLRKLWQWFLTDPSRLLAALKSCRTY